MGKIVVEAADNRLQRLGGLGKLCQSIPLPYQATFSKTLPIAFSLSFCQPLVKTGLLPFADPLSKTLL